MTATYTPQADSVAARVIAWFQANPDQALDVDALEAKFQKPRKQWHSILGGAVIGGVLLRQENLETYELEYSLGSGVVGTQRHKFPTAPPPRADVLLAGATLGQKLKTNGTRRNSPPFICDPLSFTIHSARPLPRGSGKGRFGTDWKPLFAKLKVGQSVDVPKAARPSLAKQMAESKKAGTGEFMLRKINDETFGLWRVK